MTANLVDGITGLYAQFGYFQHKALYPFGDAIKVMASAGHPVRIVLGSNKGSLKKPDLLWTYDLISQGSQARLTVMAFGNAEFHPKVICVRRADGTYAAAVGSANLTKAGLGKNAEAIITLDSTTDGVGIFDSIVRAISLYDLAGPGVFPITTASVVEDLANANIINVPQPVTTRPGRKKGAAVGVPNPGTRSPLWQPATQPAAPLPPPAPVIRSRRSALPRAARSILRSQGPVLWEKVLVASDCERQAGNPTGGVRLTQAGFRTPDGSVIDQTTYFRELFDRFDWQMTRSAPYTEEAVVPIRLIAGGTDFGLRHMAVTHKPSGEALQGNYTSLLKWGDVSSQIRSLNLVGRRLRLYGPQPGTDEPYFVAIS